VEERLLAALAAGEPLDGLALVRGDGSVVVAAEATRAYRSRPRRAKSSSRSPAITASREPSAALLRHGRDAAASTPGRKP
jgi:hypothetical protein